MNTYLIINKRNGKKVTTVEAISLKMAIAQVSYNFPVAAFLI